MAEGDRLLDSARLRTIEESGGHGIRWAVFDDDVRGFFDRWIQRAIKEAQVINRGVKDDSGQQWAIAAGEARGRGLLFSDPPLADERAGWLSLIKQSLNTTTGKQENLFWSGYPFFAEGREILAEVLEVNLHANRLEAVLELAPEQGTLMYMFDTLFWKHRSLYRAGHLSRFAIAGLAYSMEPVENQEFVIDDPEKIRRFRARDAWVAEHGSWSKDDAAAAAWLASWQPSSPEDREPIRIHTDRCAMFLPRSEWPCDDAGYQGEVVRVVPRTLTLFGVVFWKVDVVVCRPEDTDFVLPVYAAEHLFAKDWAPRVGEYVTGDLWLQGRLLADGED